MYLNRHLTLRTDDDLFKPKNLLIKELLPLEMTSQLGGDRLKQSPIFETKDKNGERELKRWGTVEQVGTDHKSCVL
ncbi:unnamed protein product [Caenorhabditis nigoni]